MKISVKKNEKNDERLAIAFRMGKPDAVPIELVNLCSFLCGWLNFKAYDYFNRPDFMLECQLKFKERFRGLGFIGPDYGVAIEPSSFGAKIVWPQNEPPWAIQMIDNVDDLPDFVKSLEEPDPLMAGYTPLLFSTYFYMKEVVGEVAPPCGMLGPFEIATALVGTENIMLGMKIYPDEIHKLMKKTTQYVKNCMGARAELFKDNLDVVYMGEDSPGMISADDFKEFVIPYTGAIFKEMGNAGSLRMWHCDGMLEHLIDLLPQLNINVLRSFDPYTDISLFKEKIGDKICLMGNIHPVRVLSIKTREEIDGEVQRIMEIGKVNGGFVMTSGGELCHGISEENLDAFLDAAEKYGGY